MWFLKLIKSIINGRSWCIAKRAEESIPDAEYICEVGVGITLLAVVMHTVKIRHDEHPTKCSVQPFRITERRVLEKEEDR